MTHYNIGVIKSFADKYTQELYLRKKSARLPAELLERAVRRLDAINKAKTIDDLRLPPGNRLHRLTGNRSEQWAVSVNNKWRICLRFEDGDTYDVELIDYH